MKLRTGIVGTLLALSLAGAAVAATGVSYSGSTTQTGQPNGTVHFKVTSKPTSVRSFSGTVHANCGGQQALITLDPTPDMTVHKHAFSFHGRFNINNGTVVIAKKVQGQIHGTFGHGGKVTGTMKFSWKFDGNAPTGFALKHCTTGTVNYTANKK